MTRGKVLLVEDDVRLSGLVCQYLQGAGFAVIVVNHGDLALDAVRGEDPDLVILDLGLPGKDGFAICRALRPVYKKPVLILTARSSDVDQVLGLELGADDYVVKPVEPRVLLARINNLLRRALPLPAEQETVLTFGRLRIDRAARAVTIGGDSIAISNGDFELLNLLASNAGKVLSRDALFQHLYRREYDGMDRLLDVRISQLRRKLGNDASTEHIKTIWGQGYLFAPGDW